jgi:predicted transcriptional regulator
MSFVGPSEEELTMITTTRPFFALTASDLMSRDLELIPREMSLRAAAHLLSQNHISGAPVVDADGKCIGVLSATDFVRWAEDQEHVAAAPTPCIHSAWQIMDYDILPPEEVGTYMTGDPVLVRSETGIADLARMMLDAHIHRLIVVDERQRPIGIISATDILAAVAQAGGGRLERVRELAAH